MHYLIIESATGDGVTRNIIASVSRGNSALGESGSNSVQSNFEGKNIWIQKIT